MLKTKVLVPLVAALGFAAVPAMSAVTQYYEVQSGPPVVLVETVPASQADMTWVPGYYDYSNGQSLLRGPLGESRPGGAWRRAQQDPPGEEQGEGPHQERRQGRSVAVQAHLRGCCVSALAGGSAGE